MSARKGQRDPIFALIEKHALTVKAADKAALALARLQSRLDAKPTEKRKHERRRLTCRAPFFDLGGTWHTPMAVIRTREEIGGHVEEAFNRLARDLGRTAAVRVRKHEKAAVAELQRRYDAFRKAHDARRNAVGLTAREWVAEEAERACMDALLALMKAKPTTWEGQTALALHLASLSPSLAPWWVMKQALENVVA